MIEISFDTKELEKQLRAYANAYGKAYVSKAVELMRNEAQKYIDKFYSQKIFKSRTGNGVSSTPYFYNRTDDLRNNSIETTISAKHGTIEGSILIDDYNMRPYNNSGNSTPPYYIVERAWEFGLHGNEITSPGVMKPTPGDLLREYWSKEKYHSEAARYAEKVVSSMNFGLLTTSSVRGSLSEIRRF